ncbi:MAG: hypothetical protein DRO40_04160 [Thermoprotei archaeon]|nr:MAG: hypothetical protein DRO40_04160 [Thermoprotei archaeon]
MAGKICLEFRGLLSRYFGDTVCTDVEDCPSIKDVVIKLAFERGVPLDHGYLLFSVKNNYIDPETSVCSIESSKIVVHYVYFGG